MAAQIPIHTLDPESTPPPDKAIRAVVSLFWPYSSSTQQCALLLADRDFRLRSRKGQVRVRFTAASARLVAQGKVGIGDEVVLDLRGAQWAHDSSKVSTPGKSVEGELVYRGELSMEIARKDGSKGQVVQTHISVNEPTPPPEMDENVLARQTPARSARVSSLKDSLSGADLVPIYSSPAFVRRQRLSGDSFQKRDEVFDAFADIDSELENEHPRKKQRISDVSSWRLAGRSPSPEKQIPTRNVSGHMEMDAPAASSTQGEASQIALSEDPLSAERLQPSRKIWAASSYPDVYPDYVASNSDTEEDEEMQQMYTQQVQSLANERLEREGVKVWDWAPQPDAAQVTEDMSEPGTTPDAGYFDEDEASDENDEMLSMQEEEADENEMAVEQLTSPASATISSVSPPNRATTNTGEVTIDVGRRSPPPPSTLTGTASGLPPPPSTATAVATESPPLQSTVTAIASRSSPPPSTVTDKASRSPPSSKKPSGAADEPSQVLSSKTPAKTLQSLFGFSYGSEGTNETPPPAIKLSSQSEKDSVMKRTYSSLFGFKASPSPEKERSPTRVPDEPTTFGRIELTESVPTSDIVERVAGEGTQPEISATPSTASRPSQVEVIDLGSSDDSSAAASDVGDEHYERADTEDHGEGEHGAQDPRSDIMPLLPQPPRAAQAYLQELMVDDDMIGSRSYSPTEVASSPCAADAADVDMQDTVPNGIDAAGTLPSALQAVGDESHVSDIGPESVFENAIEASAIEKPTIAPPDLQGQGRMSEASSTQSKNIADRYHYFSFQTTVSDDESSADEEIDTDPLERTSRSKDVVNSRSAANEEVVGQAGNTARGEVSAVSPPPPTEAIPKTGTVHSGAGMTPSSEQVAVHESQSEKFDAESQVLVSSAVQESSSGDSTILGTRPSAAPMPDSANIEMYEGPVVQVAASSFVEDSMDPARQPEEEAQLSHQSTGLETQRSINSQQVEAQLPAGAPGHLILPPSTEPTGEGLEVVLDVPAKELTSTAPSTRKHKRNASSKDSSVPLRRSPRKADMPSQSQDQGQRSTPRQTRSQRAASSASSQVGATRATLSQRNETPESDGRATTSFNSTLLTPEAAKPLRRSPRKSQSQAESIESMPEPAEEEPNKRTKPSQSTAQKSTPKTQEHKRKRSNETDISPPPKRAAASGNSSSDGTRSEQQAAIERDSVSAEDVSSRKSSFTSRFGHVPEVISTWFSPRRSTRSIPEEDKTKLKDAGAGAAAAADDGDDEKAEFLQRTSSKGIITSSAYYTPLSNLHEKLNPSSQPGVDSTIDVLAVVTDDTKGPERAKGGPRDYFTIFKIVDSSSFASQAFTTVEVFRPWRATLPVAQVGDIVLLRSFAVKSRKRQPYLLSTDASAWTVWRFGENETAKRPGSAGSARRTSRRSSVIDVGAREETKGPPVELGEGERQHVKELRAWWLAVSGAEKDG